MAPNSEKNQISFPHLQYPALRENNWRSSHQWLVGKQIQDGAENLWRVHDGLYDLTNFIDIHPGGKEWLELTKGTDITEVFETHHLKGIAESYLPKYFVKNAKSPRNSPFTFKNDGFYKTLKVKVVNTLKELPPVPKDRSKRILDRLVVSFYLLTVVTCWLWSVSAILSLGLTVLNAAILSCLTIGAHTFIHRADSFRMYYFNIVGLSHEDWRISHVISHHMHTNTAQDLELNMIEPLFQYIPYKTKANKPLRQLARYYWPFMYLLIPTFLVVKEYIIGYKNIAAKKLRWGHLVPFTTPILMYLAGGQSLMVTLALWLSHIVFGAWFISFVGITIGHHNDGNFFEGDIPKSQSMDWGEFEMSVVCDRKDQMAAGSFIALTQFGDHLLHHLFPTLDPNELELLYPVLAEHCKKFNIQHRTSSWYDMIMSHNRQIVRSEPHNFSEKSKS